MRTSSSGKNLINIIKTGTFSLIVMKIYPNITVLNYNSVFSVDISVSEESSAT